MKKILLVAKKTGVEPLGLMYLHSALNVCHNNEIEFCLVGNDDPKELSNKIHTFQPDIIGFSVWTGWHMQVKGICQATREQYPNIKIVIGGPHASWFAEDIDFADHVVIGGGCDAIVDIVAGGRTKTHRTRFSSILPIIPFRDKLYSQYPEFKNNTIKSMMASTGCAFRCAYCYNSNPIPEADGLKYRTVKSVIHEAREIFSNFPNTKLIFFQDDAFGFNINWLREFHTEWKENINKPLACQFRLEMVNYRYFAH